MCNFSNNNQSQSATSTTSNQQQAIPTTLQLIKMAAELAAIDNAADTALYSPIPISGNFQISIGDIYCSISISNGALRSQQQSETTQQSQQQSETTQQSQRVNVPRNHRVLYNTIIDFIGSYNKTLIKVDYRSYPNGGVTLSVINKGNTSKPFFTENTIDTTRILRQSYEQMHVMTGRDAFFVVIKNDNEIADLISALKAHAEKNKRDIIWVYNI